MSIIIVNLQDKRAVFLIFIATSYMTTYRVTNMETSYQTHSKFANFCKVQGWTDLCEISDSQSCVTVLHCDSVLLGKKSLTRQWIIVHSSSGSSSIFELLAHSDEGTIILHNVSNVSSNNTTSQSEMLESPWEDLLTITDLVYHNHPWLSHSSARRQIVWVQKPLILRHAEGVHGRWISLEGLNLLSTSERRKTQTCIRAPSLSILQQILKYGKMECTQNTHVLAPSF
jgi:hypothetical protein